MTTFHMKRTDEKRKQKETNAENAAYIFVQSYNFTSQWITHFNVSLFIPRQTINLKQTENKQQYTTVYCLLCLIACNTQITQKRLTEILLKCNSPHIVLSYFIDY